MDQSGNSFSTMTGGRNNNNVNSSKNNINNNNTNNMNINIQNDIIRLDNECEYIQRLMREEENPLNYQQQVNEFMDRNKELCSELIRNNEYKNSFFIYRKIEKVLQALFKKLEIYDDINFPIKSINNTLTQINFDIEINKILKIPAELIIKKLPQKYLTAYDFTSNILNNIVSTINNQGTIYMLRGKVDVALNCFLKGNEARIRYLNTYQHQYQAAIIFLNIAFCLKNKENYEESSKFLNKSIQIIEQTEKISKDFQDTVNLTEQSTYMLCLLEMLYNKNEKDFKESEITQRQKLLYLLSITYNYYGEILTKLSKVKDGEFCKKQSEVLFKQFKKNINSGSLSQSTSEIMRPGSSSSSHLTSQNIQKKFNTNNNNNNNVEDSKLEDNFSHASFQTVNTTQSYAAFGGQNITKDNIIFQKYIKVSETRYKIIIIQIKEYNCVQIILYNKPNNFLSKIIVGFQQLIEYSHKVKMSHAFLDQDSLNEFFKELSRRLQIEKGQLKIREMEYYQSIEDYTRYSKVLPANIISSK